MPSKFDLSDGKLVITVRGLIQLALTAIAVAIIYQVTRNRLTVIDEQSLQAARQIIQAETKMDALQERVQLRGKHIKSQMYDYDLRLHSLEDRLTEASEPESESQHHSGSIDSQN